MKDKIKKGVGFYFGKPAIISEINVSNVYQYYKEEDTASINNIYDGLVEKIYNKKIGNININIYRDGLFIIELDNVEYTLENLNSYTLYLQYANIIQLLISSAANEWLNCKIQEGKTIKSFFNFIINETSNENIVVFESCDEFNSIKFNSGYLPSHSLEFYNKRRNFKNFIDFCITGYDFINEGEFKEVLDLFEEKMRKVVDNNELQHILLVLERSFLEIKKLRFDISIILSWSVSERIINSLFEKHILSEFTKKERESINNRDYTASIKTRFLKSSKIIDSEMLLKIDESRKDRNKIMHGDYNLFEKNKSELIPENLTWFNSSAESLNTAIKLIKVYFDIDIIISASFCI